MTQASDRDTDLLGDVLPRDPRPIPPEPPLPSDCCDSGCAMCVHDVYAEELQDYRERLARWMERNGEA